VGAASLIPHWKGQTGITNCRSWALWRCLGTPGDLGASTARLLVPPCEPPQPPPDWSEPTTFPFNQRLKVD
jgi:hypothetical protein